MARAMALRSSDYIVYVDESGDHGLMHIDPVYPVFVLSFCIFDKKTYANVVVPAMVNLKFSVFGHDMVVLHEREIRKKLGPFSQLSKGPREAFLESLGNIIEGLEFTIVSVAIQKQKLVRQSAIRNNPYDLAMGLGLERVFLYLHERGQTGASTYFIFEARGKEEDKDLELEFRRVCDLENSRRRKLPFEIVIAHKQCNSAGLQLADMTARPIGLRVIRPTQQNRSLEVIAKKYWANSVGTVEGFGFNVFP